MLFYVPNTIATIFRSLRRTLERSELCSALCNLYYCRSACCVDINQFRKI